MLPGASAHMKTGLPARMKTGLPARMRKASTCLQAVSRNGSDTRCRQNGQNYPYAVGNRRPAEHLFIYFTPFHIAAVKGLDQELSRRQVGRKRNIVHIAEPYNDVYIRLVPLGRERISQKDNQIDLVVFNLCSDLLHTA